MSIATTKIRKTVTLRLRAFLILPLLLIGCGYQSGDYEWRSLYRQDVQTVAVPIFTNQDFHRGIEFSLTKAVINHLEATTPYKVAPKERADTILEGMVTKVTTNPLSNSSSTVLPQEQLMTLTVDFTWKDLRSGRILTQRKSFQQTAQYYPTLGESQFAGDQQAVEKLAMAIVQEMQADW